MIGGLDQLLAPDQPKTQATRAIARITSQAETISCCPIEWAVAVLAEASPESAAEFIAWVTPTPPGVAERLLDVRRGATLEPGLVVRR